MQPEHVRFQAQERALHLLPINAGWSNGEALANDDNARRRAKGTSSENELRIWSWIKRVSSATQTITETRSTFIKRLRCSLGKMRRIHKVRRHVWRICCSSLRKGQKVRIGTSSMSCRRRRSSETTGSAHLFEHMLSLHGGTTLSSRAASSLTNDVVPDYGDSSVYSSQLGSYTSGPPFEPLYTSYKEQAIHHQGAYAIVLRRFDAPAGTYDYTASSYSRP
jgi:hypothetical protein